MINRERTAFSRDRFESMPVVGILRNIAGEDIFGLLPGYVSAGFTTIEITMNTPGAAEIIGRATKDYAGRLNVGAGTVKNLRDLDVALGNGASFIVTPIIDEGVIKECVRLGIPVFPGAYTPTEIYRAWDLGADIVKVFPATALGPGYFRDVSAPLDDIRLMPTGGVSLETIPAFYEAGVSGYGIGSPLFRKDLVEKKDWPALTAHFSAFTDLLKRLRDPMGVR